MKTVAGLLLGVCVWLGGLPAGEAWLPDPLPGERVVDVGVVEPYRRSPIAHLVDCGESFWDVACGREPTPPGVFGAPRPVVRVGPGFVCVAVDGLEACESAGVRPGEGDRP